ncbi:MAG TPA: K(+)-transporting ATPase subunit C [Acidimicrobiia bacterium]|jgi:K+-transporting ATPase ATPase C chain
MRRQLVPAVIAMVVFTVLFGLVFPLVITGIGQLAFHDKAEGSIVEQHGKKIGSSLIGQAFTNAKGEPLAQYFQSRPSAAAGASGDTAAGYDPTYSSGSNFGPTNPEFLKLVGDRVKAYRKLNGLGADVQVPVDAVTASASGLDPDISVANARLQARRIANERDISREQVLHLIDDNTSDRTLGVLGEKTVNVLALNRALDQQSS